MKFPSSRIATLALLAFASARFILSAVAQPTGFNYDESKVGAYELPDPLKLADGTKVTDSATWLEKRRPEIVKLFETHMHGRSPARPADLKFEVTSTDPRALDGKATRKEISMRLGEIGRAHV